MSFTHKDCAGACEQHTGEVIMVSVAKYDFSSDYPYCQAAREADMKNGFRITPVVVQGTVQGMVPVTVPKAVVIMPRAITLVTDTEGFVVTSATWGPCFVWYRLVNGEWRETHILHHENWLDKRAT